jgi:hypothetical protein
MEVSDPMNYIGGVLSNKSSRPMRLTRLIGVSTKKIWALVQRNKGI